VFSGVLAQVAHSLVRYCQDAAPHPLRHAAKKERMIDTIDHGVRNSIYRTGQRAATTAAAARGFDSRARARVALQVRN
jgi:hypothetical protein